MKQRMRKLLMGTAALAVGLLVAIGLAIPAGVFAEAQPLVGGVSTRFAPQPVTAADHPNYYGYATVRRDPRQVCVMIYPSRCGEVAWRWDDYSGWIRSGRMDRTRVYVWPYASGWSWTWTSDTGWLAMRSDRLVIRYDHNPPIIVT